MQFYYQMLQHPEMFWNRSLVEPLKLCFMGQPKPVQYDRVKNTKLNISRWTSHFKIQSLFGMQANIDFQSHSDYLTVNETAQYFDLND